MNEDSIDKALVDNGIYEMAKKLEITKLDKQIELEKVKKSTQGTLVQKSIFVALLGLIATIIGGLITGYNSRVIEDEKYYSELIKNSFIANNPEATADNLQVLVSSGLLQGERKIDVMNSIFGMPTEFHADALSEFNNSNNSNLEDGFALRSRFDYSYTVIGDSLSVNAKDLFIAQLRPRPFYPTTIHGVRLLIAEYEDKEKKLNWGISYQSDIFPINVTFNGIYTHKIDSINFVFQGVKPSDDYFLVLEVLEFYNGLLGISNSFSYENILVK